MLPRSPSSSTHQKSLHIRTLSQLMRLPPKSFDNMDDPAHPRHQRQRSFSTELVSFSSAIADEKSDAFQEQTIEPLDKFVTRRQPLKTRRYSLGEEPVTPEIVLFNEASSPEMKETPVQATAVEDPIDPKAFKFLPAVEFQVITIETVNESPKLIPQRLSNHWDIPSTEYKIESFIGAGAYGNVYSGYWDGMKVAIKTLPRDCIDPLAVEEFKSECKVMERCHSPYHVRVYGYNLQGPDYSIVMEYLSRGSLHDVLSNKSIKKFPMFKMMYQIAAGVKHLHKVNVVHRDIKSLNIFVDDNFNIKLGDYGCSRIITHSVSPIIEEADADPRGTVRYMAPEIFAQTQRPPLTKQTDIYSMGMTFYEIYARQFPFSEDSDANIPAKLMRNERPEFPQPTSAELKNSFEMQKRIQLIKIINDCWATNPLKRPTANAVAEFFERRLINTEKVSKNSATLFSKKVPIAPKIEPKVVIKATIKPVDKKPGWR